MKIIVGGAGSVGKSIVAYLSRGNNDVAVVDEDERKLNVVAREWDVMPVFWLKTVPLLLVLRQRLFLKIVRMWINWRNLSGAVFVRQRIAVLLLFPRVRKTEVPCIMQSVSRKNILNMMCVLPF